MTSLVHNGHVRRHSNVPFSWENLPGVSKAVTHRQDHHAQPPPKLPPPPCLMPSKVPLGRSRSKKEVEDPFLAAYMECTKQHATGKLGRKDGGRIRFKKFFSFSCERSCNVREGKLVNISRLSSV